SLPKCWRWDLSGTLHFFFRPLATKRRTRWPPKLVGTTRRSRADKCRSTRCRTYSEPWGMVVIPILSLIINGSLIGWASAPYDRMWERRHPRRAAWMALAGPATNYTLMLVAAVLLRLGWSQGWLHQDPPDFAGSVLGAFFSLNLLLGTFNLLPVPPLDGSTAVMLFMGETRSQRYLDWLRGNSYAMVGLLLAIVGFRYIYAPIKAVATYYLLQGQF